MVGVYERYRGNAIELVVLVSSLFGLYLVSRANYLLFHGLAEIFSVAVAFAVFMIAWNVRQIAENAWLMLLGIGYLFIGIIDLIHTLSFEGMNVVHHVSGSDLATQLWIAARYTESLVLLGVPLFLRHRWKVQYVFVTLTAVTALLLVSIFYLDIFPTCYVEGVGLTLFKKLSEYVISFIFLATVFLLFLRRRGFDPVVHYFLVGSLITSGFSELSFTLYIDPYGFFNYLGHCFKILSFFHVYKAIVEMSIRKPYSLIFRDLEQSKEALS